MLNFPKNHRALASALIASALVAPLAGCMNANARFDQAEAQTKDVRSGDIATLSSTCKFTDTEALYVVSRFDAESMSVLQSTIAKSPGARCERLREAVNSLQSIKQSFSDHPSYGDDKARAGIMLTAVLSS